VNTSTGFSSSFLCAVMTQEYADSSEYCLYTQVGLAEGLAGYLAGAGWLFLWGWLKGAGWLWGWLAIWMAG
jgi:hypothetical protein